ncbi:MAG TPA: hypothetical protein VLF14_00215 [Candidatus Binatia bacterium]|nr:hypothetical protein [Candidatus Binatia bacterium]
MAAITTGKYSGRQPAITAFTASFSIVTIPWLGGMAPSSNARSRSVQASIRSTRSGVGGTIGRPSVHPRS